MTTKARGPGGRIEAEEAEKGPGRPTARAIALVAAGLLIAYLPYYLLPLLSAAGVQVGPEGPPSVILWNWLAVATLLLYIVGVERERLASILLVKPGRKDLEWAGIFWGIAVGWSWITYTLVPPRETGGVETIAALPVAVVVALLFTTAITEEILYRGYPIERLRALVGNIWLPVAISFVLFVAPHLTFFGPEWLLHHGVGTVLIYVLYVWRRNLWACMLLHLLINAPILIPALGLA